MLLTQIAWAQAEQRRTQQGNRLLGGYISRIQYVSHLLTCLPKQGQGRGDGRVWSSQVCTCVGHRVCPADGCHVGQGWWHCQHSGQHCCCCCC